MLVGALWKAIKQIVLKPYILIPMIIVGIASTAISFLGDWVLERPLVDLILYYDTIPSSMILGNFLFNYPLELLGMVILAFIMGVIAFIGMLSVVRMANKNSFVDAINDSVGDWKKLVGLTIIFYLAALIFWGLFSGALALDFIHPLVADAAAIIVGIVLVVALIKLVFVLPAISKFSLRKAFKESWAFTDKRFWRTLLLLIIIAIISFFIGLAIYQVGLWLGDIFDTPFLIIGEAFGATYFAAAVTNYFYSKQ